MDSAPARAHAQKGGRPRMSDLAERASVEFGRLPEPVEPYLSYWSVTAEQRCWPRRCEAGVVTIGRSSATDVCIDWDPQVSRVHAMVERVGGVWTLIDGGLSRNGTYVNGTRLSSRVRLHDRDKIGIGATVLTFCAPPQTAVDDTMVGDALPANVRLTDQQRSVLVALCRPYKKGRPYASPASNQQIAD